MRYRINSPAVASQVLAGEAILIHFDSGRYYTVEGSGADILAYLEQGWTIAEIASVWDASVGADGRTVVHEVEQFVRTLLDEGLLIARDSEAKTAEQQTRRRESTPAAAAFVAPALVTYTDLEDLLQLDPIHDVDDAGWPLPKVG